MWANDSADPPAKVLIGEVDCPVCASDAVDRALSSVETIWKTARTVSHCRHCGLFFLDDMPSSDEIREWYNSEHAYAYGPIAGALKQRFREFRSRSQHRYVVENGAAPANGRVLEVGACEGRLLRLFSSNERVGLEYSAAYAAYARRKFGITLQARDIFELDDRYDLILMSHVLEHFPDIHRVMAQVRRLLRPGGAFFAEVPNSPDPRSCVPAEIKAYLATTHTYNFTEKSLVQLLEASGFRICALDRYTYRFPPNVSDVRRREIAKVFLGDEPMRGAYALDVAGYLARSSVAMDASFEPLARGRDFAGAGDNLRVVARVAPDDLPATR